MKVRNAYRGKSLNRTDMAKFGHVYYSRLHVFLLVWMHRHHTDIKRFDELIFHKKKISIDCHTNKIWEKSGKICIFIINSRWINEDSTINSYRHRLLSMNSVCMKEKKYAQKVVNNVKHDKLCSIPFSLFTNLQRLHRHTHTHTDAIDRAKFHNPATHRHTLAQHTLKIFIGFNLII